MMPGVTFAEITNQIIDAYDQGELSRVLRHRMNTRLDVITAPGRFGDVVFEFIDHCRCGKYQLQEDPTRKNPTSAKEKQEMVLKTSLP